MKLTITGRKINLRDSFKERVDKKFTRFDKFFDETHKSMPNTKVI